jgi:hypothetical protein
MIYECKRSSTNENNIRRTEPSPPATPMRTDNSTADGIMNKTVKQKQSKSMDMRFYWLQDRVEQGQFKKNSAPGKINLVT